MPGRDDDRPDADDLLELVIHEDTAPSYLATAAPASGQWSSHAAAEVVAPHQPYAPGETDSAQPAEASWAVLFLREIAETLVLSLVIFLLIRTVVQNYRIEGQSMEPNFHDGEYLLVNKLSYRLGEFTRGDVIVFRYPNDPERDFIKRIVGLPGDTVEIRDGVVFINALLLDEPYDVAPINYQRGPTVVEPNHLYVLGDNRPYSSDSHQWGQLSQEFVIGKAWLAVWPPTTWGLVPHYQLIPGAQAAQGP